MARLISAIRVPVFRRRQSRTAVIYYDGVGWASLRESTTIMHLITSTIGLQVRLWILVVMGVSVPVLSAAIPGHGDSMPRISGVYQVVDGNDPLFPQEAGVEWFLDFGPGMSQDMYHGNVSVSLRRNPSVRVRIMVWQADPGQRRLLLGNTAADASNRAVARADWRVSQRSGRVLLERGDHWLVLQRPAPGVY